MSAHSPSENIFKFEKIITDTPDVVIILARSSIERIPSNIEIITFQEL